MSKTKHIQKRMSQRGIRAGMLDMVQEFGSWNGDKCILNRKACSEVLSELDRIRKELIKLQEKGGLVVVENEGTAITTYRLNSYSRHY